MSDRVLRRVGLMVPSSNTIMEPDFQRALADVATVHTARMYLGDPITPDGERDMLRDHAVPAARDLGTLDPALVVFGCTSAGTLGGRTADEHLRASLAEVVGAPVLGTFDAMTAALQRRAVVRVAVLTPYPDALNVTIEAALSADGFDVRRTTGLGIAINVDVARVAPEAIVAAGRRAVPADAEALAVPCTNFAALEARDALEAELGLPVVTANSAVLEAVRRSIEAEGPTTKEHGDAAV